MLGEGNRRESAKWRGLTRREVSHSSVGVSVASVAKGPSSAMIDRFERPVSAAGSVSLSVSQSISWPANG